MQSVTPYLDIEKILAEYKGQIPGCIVDTQLLVAVLYDPHEFNEDALQIIKSLAKFQVPIYTTVTTRSEFVDINRRIMITEGLMTAYSQGQKQGWSFSKSVQDALKKHKNWIDTQAKNETIPILNDYRIKDCKETFSPLRHSGKTGWVEICEEFLEGNIIRIWDQLVNDFGINYVDLRDDDINDILPNGINWSDMYGLMEKTSLSSSDAMITNVFLSSVFPFAITADYDLAYAVEISDTTKKIFAPNNMYRNKFKGKKFK